MTDMYIVKLMAKVSICLPLILVLPLGAAAGVIQFFHIDDASFLAIAVGIFVAVPVAGVLCALMFKWLVRGTR
jgi:hypothetical protein